MDRWKVTLRPAKNVLQILVENSEGDLLRARLPLGPEHPRALLTLLEGLSLWTGEVIDAVISVDERAACMSERRLFGGDLWPVESTMVRFIYHPHERRRRRIPGMGDFRALYGVRGGRP